jgi:hypothetical protein
MKRQHRRLPHAQRRFVEAILRAQAPVPPLDTLIFHAETESPPPARIAFYDVSFAGGAPVVRVRRAQSGRRLATAWATIQQLAQTGPVYGQSDEHQRPAEAREIQAHLRDGPPMINTIWCPYDGPLQQVVVEAGPESEWHDAWQVIWSIARSAQLVATVGPNGRHGR